MPIYTSIIELKDSALAGDVGGEVLVDLEALAALCAEGFKRFLPLNVRCPIGGSIAGVQNSVLVVVSLLHNVSNFVLREKKVRSARRILSSGDRTLEKMPLSSHSRN